MYMLWPVVFIPFIYWDEVAFCIARGTGWGIESGAILSVGGKAIGHLVVDFQDAEFSTVLPIFSFVLAHEDGDSFHCVFHTLWINKKPITLGEMRYFTHTDFRYLALLRLDQHGGNRIIFRALGYD